MLVFALALLLATVPAAHGALTAETRAALEAALSQKVTGAAKTMQDGMMNCMISTPTPDDPKCITNILGSPEAIISMAWNPGSIQLGASRRRRRRRILSADKDADAEVDSGVAARAAARHAEINEFFQLSSTTLTTKGPSFGKAMKSIGKALASPFNAVGRAITNRQIKKESKKTRAAAERAAALRDPFNTNVTNMTEGEKWHPNSWEQGVEDKLRCSVCCDGASPNAVPFFFRDERLFRINPPGDFLDKVFVKTQQRSCYRNKFCSEVHVLNHKIRAWVPGLTNKEKKIIKAQKLCPKAEYEYYSSRTQCEAYCGSKTSASASASRLSKQRREDVATRIQHTCYKLLDPFLAGYFRVGTKTPSISRITITRQRMTISINHDGAEHYNQIKIFRLGERRDVAKVAAVTSRDKERGVRGLDRVFPLHFTGTIELWAADMQAIEFEAQKKPCWDGKSWLGINKCVRFGTKKDPENFIPDFFSTQRYSLAFPTPDQVERGVYQYHLRVMVEDPRRSGWRVTDGAKPRPDGGTDTTSASGLRGKDWRKYMEKRKAMCMDAGDPITPFDELEKDNVKLAEHLRKRHCREAMSSWLPFFKMLSSKDKEGADAFDVTVNDSTNVDTASSAGGEGGLSSEKKRNAVASATETALIDTSSISGLRRHRKRSGWGTKSKGDNKVKGSDVAESGSTVSAASEEKEHTRREISLGTVSENGGPGQGEIPAGTDLISNKAERYRGFALYLNCFDLTGTSQAAYVKKYKDLLAPGDKKARKAAHMLQVETEKKCEKAQTAFVDAYMRTYNEARTPRTIGMKDQITGKLQATADTWKGMMKLASGQVTASNIARIQNGTLVDHIKSEAQLAAKEQSEKNVNEASGGRLAAGKKVYTYVTDRKDEIAKLAAEKAKREEDGTTLTPEEQKLAQQNEQQSIVTDVATGLELVYALLPQTLQKKTLAQDLRAGAACALGIATTAITMMPTTAAVAANKCITWVGNMVLRRLVKLDKEANNRMRRQRFAGAPQTSFLNALRFTRSYTKELMAIVHKDVVEVEKQEKAGKAAPARSKEKSDGHRFSEVTRGVLDQVLCGVNAMNKYYAFVKVADSLAIGSEKDAERKTAEDSAMELAKGFQLDLSRALQLEQLKLAFGITDALAVMSSDDIAHENAVDDDQDDEDHIRDELLDL